jgi:hypothetical protein
VFVVERSIGATVKFIDMRYVRIMTTSIIDTAQAIAADRFPDAAIVFAAGSLVRGEGTPSSDIDLVVVHRHIEAAYRESFRYGAYPVEAFVHDPETLNYFFFEVDRPAGVPSLPCMVTEGIEVPGPNDLSQQLKTLAQTLLDAGPPPLSKESRDRLRYTISDTVDDLRYPRSADEVMATGSVLYGELADYYLRTRGMWSAKGKALPRALQRADTHMAKRFSDCFADLMVRQDATTAIKLCEDLLASDGGFLFDGYRSAAPSAWRKPLGNVQKAIETR